MNNLTPTKIENAIDFITRLTDEGNRFLAVEMLAEMWGTEQQVTEARRCREWEIHHIWLQNRDGINRDLLNRRELVFTEIMHSIAEKDVALYRRVAQAF